MPELHIRFERFPSRGVEKTGELRRQITFGQKARLGDIQPILATRRICNSKTAANVRKPKA
jgi:hypothetical protein